MVRVFPCILAAAATNNSKSMPGVEAARLPEQTAVRAETALGSTYPNMSLHPTRYGSL
jgi:hypothetical protein